MSVLSVNGREYAVPRRPVVVVCLNGTSAAHLEAAVESGTAPFLARMLENILGKNSARVLLQITYPYVTPYGSLGFFCKRAFGGIVK